ncbi:MAG: helix-turn-helix transcriptional regulator [Chitinophagaceae bacterium]|nr:helix-turn-helix transcriptional regulator [Chitinophagaceae bacterium]
MNMKLNNVVINPEYDSLFNFKTKEEKYEHDAQMISYRILSEIEKHCDEKKIKRKDLAEMVGTSTSYITQLFTGVKSVNTTILAKFENALDVSFEIKMKLNSESYQEFIERQFGVDYHIKEYQYSNERVWCCISNIKGNIGTEIVNNLETENEQKQVA